MSSIREVSWKCSACGTEFPVTLYNSINVGIDPEAKPKVLDGSFFQYRCPRCGNADIICYPILYHDPEQEIMIQVLWNESEFGIPMDKEMKRLISVMGHENYRHREVFGYQELLEKIRIFDAGLNDFAIALLKTIQRFKQPELGLFFHEINERGLCFIQVQDGNPLPEYLILNTEAYRYAEEFAKKWEKPYDRLEYLRVDESYFHDNVAEAMRELDK